MSVNGIERFIPWADLNYTNTQLLAYQLYDRDVVNGYYSSINKDVKYVSMFTYGILKYPHNIKREGGIDIVENSTIVGHKMFSTGSFPVTKITGNENDVVFGTLFKVPERIVERSYDQIEGYSPNRKKDDNMYNREEVTVITPSGESVVANMYIANPSYFSGWYASHYNIPTGDFDDMRLYVKPQKTAKKKGV
jgi:hypothetical protein